MSIPDYQTLMLSVLRLAKTGERRVLDVIDPIADEFGLSQEQREELLPSGRQRTLHNRIHWAKFYLTKAGLLSAPGRGRFAVIKEGTRLLASNPAKVDVQTLLQYPAFKDFYKAETSETVPTKLTASTPTQTVTPEEQIEVSYRAVEDALRTELLDRILANSPAFFEQLIVDVLIAMGYGGSHKDAARQLGKSGDGGVDGVVNQDRLGLERVYVQAKRYQETIVVGRPDVQAFVGSLVGFGATKGVFVTTSNFSAQAREFVKHLSQRVVLVDGRQLTDLMIEHDVGVRVSRSIQFKRLDEDFFSEE